MCGIIGYVGKEEAAPLLLKGLESLEYRGYDSAGILTLSDKFHCVKNKGKVKQAILQESLSALTGKIGIAQTRWATHGSVTKENAHPHFSNSGDIAVVHNGIIENYQELKKELEKQGFVFKTETDTEVLPNLIQKYMKDSDSFEKAFEQMLRKIEGDYAVAAMFEKEHKIAAARKGSPLVLGVGAGEFFVASDIPAFLNSTKKVIFLRENDFAFLSSAGIEVFNLAEGKVQREIQIIEWNAEQAKKGNFDHFMLKEISEQAGVIRQALQQDKKSVMEIAKAIEDAHGVFFVACGSSYHACLAASYKFSEIAREHVNVVHASEFHNYNHFLKPDSLVIAVSQSGETADVLDAVKAAKEKGSQVISIVNVMGSSLTRESDSALMMNAGPEICVLSTKTYTSQLTILTLIAYALADVYDEGYENIRETINYIYYLTSDTMKNHIKKLSEKLKDVRHIYLIGRDLQYPTALEAALKIKEVSYIHAEGFPAGELKHGPIALIEKGTPCIVFTSEETEKQVIGSALELKARGAYIIGIGPNKNEAFDFFIKIREGNETNSICQIIPIQILAYQLAVLKGCDPDKPRNLAKSVTVR
ncbi:MAG: glutamine--fructose-6-phosphate transaminase (isomerizing) [Candidatus Micrarchaeota archaeon]